MPGTDLMPVERLRRVQPGAAQVESIRGTLNLVKAEVRKMEQRGEVTAYRQFARLDRRTGVLEIPYVRLRTRASVRREQVLTRLALSGAGIFFLAVVAWLAWESRYVIGAVLAIAATIMLVFWLAPHWTRGCPGMHCQGCRG